MAKGSDSCWGWNQTLTTRNFGTGASMRLTGRVFDTTILKYGRPQQRGLLSRFLKALKYL